MESETKSTVSKIIGNKTIEQSIIKRFRSMSKAGKIFLSTYGLFATGAFCAYTYNDGKGALIAARSKNSEISAEDEWLAIKSGCSANTWNNFWGSVFFPMRVISGIFPFIVAKMNKKE